MSEIIKGCLGFKGEKGEHGEVGTPIPYEGTFQELQNSEEDKGRFYIIMDEQDEVYYRHWVYYDEENEQWKDGGEYLANLVINLEDLTQEEWESLKSNLTNYYKRYESVYTTTQENEINIPINISQYNTLAILEVYIEGRMLNRNEYAINGTNSITLNIPLSEIGTKVHFIVYRSVCASNEDLNELKGPKGDSGAIVFNTVAEMKADEDLQVGDACQTLGYYSANDEGAGLYKIVDDSQLVDDGGSIHSLTNGLKAQLIVKDNINVKMFGAYGDNSHDDSTAFNNALNYLRFTLNKTLYIPNGNYQINDTITLYDNQILYGENRFTTNIVQGSNMLDKPLITTDISGIQLQNISLFNLSIKTFGLRTKIGVDILNNNSTRIENCYFVKTDNSISDFHGVHISKTQEFIGTVFVSRVHNTRLSKCHLLLNTTDSYIFNNEIWGDTDKQALILENASNTIITNNQFVGGEEYGSIFIKNDVTGLKISNNYFDGSYVDLNTQHGIYSENAILKNSVISNNNFWRQKASGINLFSARNTIISNNNFENNDYYNNKIPDIIIGQSESYGNIIDGNTFFRDTYYDISSQSVKERPTDNPPPVLRIGSMTGGYNPTKITNNNCSFPQFYMQMEVTGSVISSGNLSNKFFHENITTDLTQDSKDGNFLGLHYRYSDDLLTDSIYSLISENFIQNSSRYGYRRIDNPKVFLETQLGTYDINKKQSEEYKVYITNPANVTNKPDFLTESALIHYVPVVSNTYAIQMVYQNKSDAPFKIRFLSNGSWGAWR